MHFPLPIEASPAIQAALDEIGRTEDVSLSPDGSRLGLAAFARNQIYLFSVELGRGPESATIRISDYAILSSDHLKEPHGFTFLGNDHIVVCNRQGDVCVFHIPLSEMVSQQVTTKVPVASISAHDFLKSVVKTPGSVASYKTGVNQYRIFVCNDQWHFVSVHMITLSPSVQIKNEGVLLERGLKIPDGVSVSPDQKWLAISNHIHGQVLVFENIPILNRRSEPVALLEGVVCPHGLGFDQDGDLFVADAASPYLHVYHKPEGGWRGQMRPTQSVRLLDNDTFYSGRYASREGGVKGVSIYNPGGLLITTHKLAALEFRNLETLKSGSEPVDEEHLAALRQARDTDIARKKREVLSRKWSLSWRFRHEIFHYMRGAYRLIKKKRLETKQLIWTQIHRSATHSILDRAGPVVSLATDSNKLQTVSLAIETIAAGTLKPGRIILWISEAAAQQPVPAGLERLKARGLEIKVAENYGAHTKYYPYLESEKDITGPLVTADADNFYPSYWLESLVKAHQSQPDAIHCHWARRMSLTKFNFEPYSGWRSCTTDEPSHLNSIFSAYGVIYPPGFLKAVKTRGKAFQEICPTASDIWLTHIAFQEEFKVAQVAKKLRDFDPIPASQDERLSEVNISQGANQIQLCKVFSPADRSKLFALQKTSLYFS